MCVFFPKPNTTFNNNFMPHQPVMEEKIMTKKEMIHALSKKTGMSLKEAETAFTAVVDLITEEIVEKEEAAVSGLGTFMIRSRSSRKGRNFQTGTSVQIPSSKSVGFRAGKNLKEAVNK